MSRCSMRSLVDMQAEFAAHIAWVYHRPRKSECSMMPSLVGGKRLREDHEDDITQIRVQ